MNSTLNKTLGTVADPLRWRDEKIKMSANNSNFTMKCLNSQRIFLWVSAFILLLTALIKLGAARQSIPLLLIQDPVFPFLNKQQLFDYAGILELFLVCILVWSSVNRLRLLAIAWISGCFLTYHLGLVLVGAPQSYCPCLGSIGGRFGVDDKSLSKISFLIACFLWCGSILFLLIEYLVAGPEKKL